MSAEEFALLKPCTSAPSLERNREVSKAVIGEIPESPLKSLREKAFLPIPRGVTMPTPDMTTLSFMERNFQHNIHAKRFVWLWIVRYPLSLFETPSISLFESPCMIKQCKKAVKNFFEYHRDAGFLLA